MATKIAKSDFIGNGPIRYRVAERPGGAAMVGFTVDYADAPVPQHYYVADYFQIVEVGTSALLVFGKFDGIENKTKLRSKIEIYFPAIPFVRQLWDSSRGLHESLRQLVVAHGMEPAINSKEISADKVQTVQSNNVLMMTAGGECMADFFYISPREIFFKPQKKKDIEIEPLARIILEPHVLLGFLNACKIVADTFSVRFKDELQDLKHEDENLESN